MHGRSMLKNSIIMPAAKTINVYFISSPGGCPSPRTRCSCVGGGDDLGYQLNVTNTCWPKPQTMVAVYRTHTWHTAHIWCIYNRLLLK